MTARVEFNLSTAGLRFYFFNSFQKGDHNNNNVAVTQISFRATRRRVL